MKLQNEILKALEKQENANKYINFPYKLTTGCGNYFDIGITDGHFIRFYNSKHFFINVKNDYFNGDPINVETITKTSDTRMLKLNLEFTAVINRDNYQLIEFCFLDSDEKLYINAKFKKYFETKYINFNEYTFKANSHKSPLILELSGNIHGVILPVNYNRG